MPQSKDTAKPHRDIQERIRHGYDQSQLPPSIESAYYNKCIELKRRIEEIEKNNDKKRVSLERVNRDIHKLRLERVLLIDSVKRNMEPRPDDSDKSESPPPTPQEKPTRMKRKSKMASPPIEGTPVAATSPAAPLPQPSVGTPAGSTTYANGADDQTHADEDVHMAEDEPEQEAEPEPGMSGGFTAVNN